LFINLIPLIPLSLKGEGEIKKEGLTPLLDASLVYSPSNERRKRP